MLRRVTTQRLYGCPTYLHALCVFCAFLLICVGRVGHQGGRLLPERACHYLHGTAATRADTLHNRVNDLRGTAHAALVGDLHVRLRWGLTRLETH